MQGLLGDLREVRDVTLPVCRGKAVGLGSVGIDDHPFHFWWDFGCEHDRRESSDGRQEGELDHIGGGGGELVTVEGAENTEECSGLLALYTTFKRLVMPSSSCSKCPEHWAV
jgi:hypothetical protein